MRQTAEVCLIPFNLISRYTCLPGYPPPDHAVRNFLLANGEHLEKTRANILLRCFFLALFDEAKKAIEPIGHSKIERISNFRELMSKDQSMKSTGEGRQSFYRSVLTRAHEVGNRFLTVFVLLDPFVV